MTLIDDKARHTTFWKQRLQRFIAGDHSLDRIACGRMAEVAHCRPDQTSTGDRAYAEQGDGEQRSQNLA